MMRIDRAGIPFIAAALLGGAACMAFGLAAWAAAAAAAAGSFGFFFRDPERRVPVAPGVVVSPADGRVVFAGAAEAGVAPSGAWRQVSVFLSPLDVHVNRVPVTGRVTRVERSAGRFLPAYRREAAAENERCEIWIEHGAQTVVCRQVVGVLARRIVCRLSAGVAVAAGQRFGIMKFGSRMDVFIPEGVRLLVQAGEVVRGGETILAVLEDIAAPE